MPNQYSKDKLGLGEYCPRPQIRMSEEQYEQFLADVKASKLSPSRYVRCKLGLEPWPATAAPAPSDAQPAPKKRRPGKST